MLDQQSSSSAVDTQHCLRVTSLGRSAGRDDTIEVHAEERAAPAWATLGGAARGAARGATWRRGPRHLRERRGRSAGGTCWARSRRVERLAAVDQLRELHRGVVALLLLHGEGALAHDLEVRRQRQADRVVRGAKLREVGRVLFDHLFDLRSAERHEERLGRPLHGRVQGRKVSWGRVRWASGRDPVPALRATAGASRGTSRGSGGACFRGSDPGGVGPREVELLLRQGKDLLDNVKLRFLNRRKGSVDFLQVRGLQNWATTLQRGGGATEGRESEGDGGAPHD